MSDRLPSAAVLPRRNEPRKRRRGESYLDWLKRTLRFARAHGQQSNDGTWTCGYCGVGRHGDCIIDCGCKTCAHPPFSGHGGGFDAE